MDKLTLLVEAVVMKEVVLVIILGAKVEIFKNILYYVHKYCLNTTHG